MQKRNIPYGKDRKTGLYPPLKRNTRKGKPTMNKSKPVIENDKEPKAGFSRKELAKQYRHEAYLRAKEYRKTDPRQIAMKEKQKEQRKEAYQKGKESRKAYQDEIKKAMKEKNAATKIDKQKKLRSKVVSGSTIKQKKFF